MSSSDLGNDWSTFESWTELFDAVCTGAGHVGNADLAYAMCEKTNRKSEKDIETMTRNIGNWRNGTNLPSRTNFRALTDALGIAKDPYLKNHWMTLFAAEKSGNSPEISITGTKIESKNTYVFLSGTRWKSTALLLGTFSAIVIGAFWAITWWTDDRVDVDALFAANKIVWRPNVDIREGEKVVIHGKRGICGELPPTEEYMRTQFPTDLKHGHLEVGELGARYSRRCQGPTAAREVVYVGETAGTEQFSLYGDDITVVIHPYE